MNDRSTRAEVQAAVSAVPFWWHSIDVGHGVVTPGEVSHEHLRRMAQTMGFSDLSKKSVLDIGAYDGFFSFEAERHKASRVVALDHFVWEHDLAGIMKAWRATKADSGGLDPSAMAPFHRPNELPGKVAFDTAHKMLDSRVETVISDFSKMDLSSLGTFDVVLFLGVLYHLENPLAAMRRVREVTGGYALIETEAVYLDGYEHLALCEFFPGHELNNDPSNWWAPNERALAGLCRAAGFSRVEVLSDPPKPRGAPARLLRTGGNVLRAAGWKDKPKPRRYRLIVRASG